MFNPPLELAMEITEWASLEPYRSGVFHADNASLLALTSTSRLWSRHAQRILFRKARLKAIGPSGPTCISAFESFLDTIESMTQAKSVLPWEVRALSVAVRAGYSHTCLVDISSIAILFPLLPNLQAFHIDLLDSDFTVPDSVLLDDHALHTLANNNPGRIKHFSMHSFNLDPTVIEQLLKIWSSIHTLSVDATRLGPFKEDPPPLPALRTLNVASFASNKCLSYLLKCSSGTFSAIYFSNMRDLGRSRKYLSREITDLTVCDSAPVENHLTLFSEFTQLERLFVGFPLESAILEQLSPTIRVFGFDPYLYTHKHLQRVLSFLASRHQIHTVTTLYHDETDHLETSQIGRIKRFCRKHGKQWAEVYRVCCPLALAGFYSFPACS